MRARQFHYVTLVVAIAIAGPGQPVSAQSTSVGRLVMLASDSEARIRLDQLIGKTSSSGYLIRWPSRLMAEDSAAVWRTELLPPELYVIHNSGLPYSLNDGPLWASRGWNESVTAGLSIVSSHVQLIIAPTLVSEQNLPFQVIPYSRLNPVHRSDWANPFHPPPESIDLPLRFGDQSIFKIDPGQTSLTVAEGNAAFGFGTENLWWGPGIRNAITLSNNAPGFPHLFIQTKHPARTRLGTFDAQWILGQLSESEFFDTISTNNSRALAGLAMTWSPPSDTGLSIGFARLVMAARSNDNFPLGNALDVFRTVGHPFEDSTRESGRDQITSLFGRWVFPEAGFEAYVEWARFEEPLSIRDLLEYPGHSEAYTLGLQWAHPLDASRTFQLQTEVSYLEPDPSIRVRPVATTYTSRSVVQGFTQLGQALGASIGPGSSSQWLAGDVFAPRWRLGAYLSRIRWDNGVMFEPIVPDFKRQDVTLLAGVRGGVRWRGFDVLVDFAHAARFDYLYQAFVLSPFKTGGIDLLNNTLSVTLSKAVAR